MSLHSTILRVCSRLLPLRQKSLQIRESHYKSSPFASDVEVKVNYETTRDPVDWEYVLRALPTAVVPEPIKKDSYPSGWKPQADDLSDKPYFVARTKNHMIPCYLKINRHQTKKTTVLRKIKGDIYLLENELRQFLKSEIHKPLRFQVNEFAGFIRVHGDQVNAIKYFLEQRGF